MPDENNPRDRGERSEQNSEAGSAPASVIFMEMMRRAAATSHDEDEPSPPPGTAPVEAPPPSQMSEVQRRQAAALEAQRVRRLQRRQARRQEKRASVAGGLVMAWVIVIVSGALIATILSFGTAPESLSPELRQQIDRASGGAEDNGAAPLVPLAAGAMVSVPTPVPTPNFMIRIGIVSGHMGPENDPGAVCTENGEVVLTENAVNFEVAQRVWRALRERGYTVDFLEEFDTRLENYQANLLVSIHSNDCRDYGEYVSGYLVAQAESRPADGADARLVECLATHYGAASELPRRYGLTRDMTDYHIFREIDINTPGAIIELGFMKDDQVILTTRPDLLAQGIVDGILCFLDPTGAPVVALPTPVLTATPAPVSAGN